MLESDRPNHFRIDTSRLSESERIAFARHFLGPGYEIAPLPDRSFEGGADIWLLDSLIAAEDHNLNCRAMRIESEGPTGAMRLRLVTGGRLSGTIDGQKVDLKPGDLAFDGSAATVNVELSDFSCQVVRIPGESVGYDPMLHPGVIFVSRDDAEGLILGTAISAFFARLREVDNETAERLAKVLVGLVQGYVSGLPVKVASGDLRRRDRLRAMRLFIEENLAAKELGVDLLMREFNTSRAVIYRLFVPFGGVRHYVTERRLSRAMGLLNRESNNHLRIAEIAEAVGYPDQRHFSRAFRQRFAITPSEARLAFRGELLEHLDAREGVRELGERYRSIMGADKRR